MGKTSEGQNLTGQPMPLDVTEAATLLLDAHGSIASWSRKAEQLLGYPAAEVLGRPVAALLDPPDAARVPAPAERCRADNGWSGLLSAQHRDGNLVDVHAHVIPLEDHGGRAAWLVLAVGATRPASWPLSRAALERMVTHSPIGLAVVDTDLRFVWSNAALEQLSGVAVEQRRGRRLGEIRPGLDVEMIEAQMHRVLETGVPVLDFEHVGRVRSDPTREHAYSVDFVRLDDDSGQPLGVYYSVIDITDRYKSRRRLSLLNRASEYIGRSLDVMQTAQDLADVAVPELAEFVAVDLLDSVIKGTEPTPGSLRDTDTVPLRRQGHQSIHKGVPEAVVDIGGVARYHAWSPTIRCLMEGRSWRAARLDPQAPEWATDIPGGRAASFEELGLHTSMVVPIRARGITLGIATFFRLHDEAFEEDDLRLAEDFVARAAVCIDNARLFGLIHDSAEQFQRMLLPALPDLRPFSAAAVYRPAAEPNHLGGDWYDAIMLPDNAVGVVIGDVVGHDLYAAAAMSQTRSMLRALLYDRLTPPSGILTQLDRTLHATTENPVTTVCLARIEAEERGWILRWSSAGHLPLLLVTPDRRAELLYAEPGLPLGVNTTHHRPDHVRLLHAGATVVFFTDGLVEHPAHPIDQGLNELAELATAHADLLLEDFVRMLADHHPSDSHDDMAILALRIPQRDAAGAKALTPR